MRAVAGFRDRQGRFIEALDFNMVDAGEAFGAVGKAQGAFQL